MWIKKVFAIPYIPVEFVKLTWDNLLTCAKSNNQICQLQGFNSFVQYFEKEWLQNPSPYINLKLWNIHNRTDHRTNNYCESWHSKYIRRTRITHPNNYGFIDFLIEYHNEQIDDLDLLENEKKNGFQFKKNM